MKQRVSLFAKSINEWPCRRSFTFSYHASRTPSGQAFPSGVTSFPTISSLTASAVTLSVDMMVTVVTLVDSAVGYGRCETEEHNKMKIMLMRQRSMDFQRRKHEHIKK